MSDFDLDFDFDVPEPEPEVTPDPPPPSAAPPPVSAPPPSIDNSALIAEAENRLRNSLGRFLTDDKQNAGPSKDEVLNQLVQDPNKFFEAREQLLLAQTQQIAQQQIQHLMLINEFAAKEPLFNQYRDYIAVEVGQVMREAEATGRSIDDRFALQQGIERFKNKFQGQATTVKKQALDLDLSTAPVPTNSGPPDFEKMSDAEFEKYDRAIRRKLYGY